MMQTITSLDIIQQLERLAAACPWDTCDIWVSREPAGTYRFTAFLHENDKYGMGCDCCSEDTPERAVTEILKRTGARTPEIARDKAIAKLKEQIEKLQAVVIGLPPYVPNRELTNGEAAVRVHRTITI